MKKFVVCLALIISCAVILTAVPLSSSKNEKSEVSYSIVRKRIGDTDLEVEFENELNIYRGDNCSFCVNFINHNENLRYAINMDLKGADEALKKSVLKMASVVTKSILLCTMHSYNIFWKPGKRVCLYAILMKI